MTITESKEVKYFARPGAMFGDEQAQELGPEVTDAIIEAGDDRKAAEVLVERAASPEHCAHDLFEWDDAKCGHQYRLGQASCIIRHIGIVPDGGVRLNVPAFVTLKIETLQSGNSGEDPEAEFRTVPMIRALTEDELRRRLLRQCMTIVNGQRDTLSQFEEAADLVDAIDVLWAKVCGM